jgi:hypothetical protein
MRVPPAILLGLTFIASVSAARGQEVNWGKVDETFGRKAAVASGDVHRYGFPRTDLNVTLDGVAIKPALALGGWIAFKPMGSEAMVMGDLVLLEAEITPVMTTLVEHGIQITALHNHLLRAHPMPFYMHVGGQGEPIKLATAIRAALTESGTPLQPSASSAPAAVELDGGQLDQIMGVKGKANGGVYQFALSRRETIREAETVLAPPGPLGVATSINFQPSGGGTSAVTGDFVLMADEVNPVIKTLRDSGIEVTALHSHMLTEQPRLFFMHFWANDDSIKLAKGLRAALDKTKIGND